MGLGQKCRCHNRHIDLHYPTCKWAGTPSVVTPTTVRSVAKPPMVMRSIRVPLRLWNDAKAKADEREESISDVIREALERYVRRR